MRRHTLILFLFFTTTLRAIEPGGFSVEDIITDIYQALSEDGEVDYEDLKEDLYELSEHPIDINSATEQDLLRLRFLTPSQIDDILLLVYKSPLHSLQELRLLPSLKDYELRDLLPFLTIVPSSKKEKITPREELHNAHHEIITRIDARNIENSKTDPIYTSIRYRLSIRRQYSAGLTIRRPEGATAQQLQYGGFIELHDIWKFKTIVAGNYQAHFGQGLVVSNPFHSGRSMYVLNAGSMPEGLRKYASTDNESFHGIGGTITAHKNIDITAFYSITKPNDSIRKHTLGTNLSFHRNKFAAGITFLENLYSDSLRYYNDKALYRQNYFRGNRQAVIGAYARYNWGKVDFFGEVATAQNKQWGIASLVGARITPVSDIGLLLLYRYYSPTYDNTWGYAYCETSKINDENGVYLGIDIRQIKNWRFAMFGDFFYFSDFKYLIPYAPSIGYDTQTEISYFQPKWNLNFRLRAKEKGKLSTYSTRLQFNWEDSGWRLRTRMDANMVKDTLNQLSYGISVYQDIQYGFASVPITLLLRAQGFDIKKWNNRIYMHEHDVLNSFSIPASYGVGGRFYVYLRYRIIPQLSLYFRVSETIYSKKWASTHDKALTRTDIHLLLRATF